jgi:hypothetical protein
MASQLGLGVGHLGKVIYLGPNETADQLRAVAALRTKDVARLPAELRTAVAGKRRMSWPRLAEPRQLVASIAQENGLKVVQAELIPHDLWQAGELPELTMAERLSVLLMGFDLTFEIRPAERAIVIVPLKIPAPAQAAGVGSVDRPAQKATTTTRPPRGKKQVYTLRVEEKPVGAVLRQLGERLKWTIQIDETAIQAAGKSLNQNVSFSVTDADREQLLAALLTPAGLEYRIEGEQIFVTPKR